MPTLASLACPKCGAASLRLVLKTSWGEYYACAPCKWSIFAAERATVADRDSVPAAVAALSNTTAASVRNSATA